MRMLGQSADHDHSNTLAERNAILRRGQSLSVFKSVGRDAASVAALRDVASIFSGGCGTSIRSSKRSLVFYSIQSSSDRASTRHRSVAPSRRAFPSNKAENGWRDLMTRTLPTDETRSEARIEQNRASIVKRRDTSLTDVD